MDRKFIKSEYQGFFAEFYDILHSETYDVPAYIEFAKRFGSTLLELGSGTGRILIPLARAGFDVTGLELSQEMLDICKGKLEKESNDVKKCVKLIYGDMIDFQLDKRFDLIFAACNTFCHLISTRDIEKTLRCVKKHLKDQGVFIIDNSVPDIETMVETNGKEEIFKFAHPITGRKIVDKFKATYDFLNQLEYNHIILEEYDDGRLTRNAESNETLTYFFPRELKILLQSNGFYILEELGSLLKSSPITEQSREMIFLCKKI